MATASEVPLILVWGATPTSEQALFEDLERAVEGPPAGAFRGLILKALTERFSPDLARAIFSEDGETFDHHEHNAGFYEPLQLAAAKLVLLLLPGERSLGVNTWEMALALETDNSRQPLHSHKVIFVLPERVYRYLLRAFEAGVSDRKDFKLPLGEEPSLGPANSFAARWVHLAIWQLAGGSKLDPWVAAPSVFPFISYVDSLSWGLEGKPNELSHEARELIDRILLQVEAKL
jgi:hypothetical protein